MVIGGLISSTLLTLVVPPVLYYMVFTRRKRSNSVTPAIIAVPLMLLASASFAQTPISITLDQAVQMALRDHPVMNAAGTLSGAAARASENSTGTIAAQRHVQREAR